MLEQLDAIAAQKYPARKEGQSPNRSQMILDCIQVGLDNLSTVHDSLPPQRQTTAAQPVHDTVSLSPVSLSDNGIEELIKQHVAQQVQIQVQVQQEVQRQLGQASPEIAELRQEVAEIKKF